MVHGRDDASNLIIEYFNHGDTRNSNDGEWTPLITTYTKDTIMSFAPYNDTGVDLLLGSNGTDNFWEWSGAICVMDGAVAEDASTITVKKVPDDPKTNPTDGFPSSGTLTYKDTAGAIKSLAYSSKTNTVFTMSTPGNTTASADTTGVAQAPDITTHSGIPKFTTIITAQGRLWGSGEPTQPTVMQGSEVGVFTNFVVGNLPSDPLTEDFPEGGGNVALGSIDNWILVFKENQVIAYGLEFPSSTTVAAVRKHVSDIGIASVKALDRVGSDYIYASKSGQIRRISRLQAENLFIVEDLTLPIRPTIENFDWQDCALKYWPKERLVVASSRTDSDQTNNDKWVVLQFSQDEEGNPLLNHGIRDIFTGDFTVYKDDLYFGGSVASRVYKAFDGFSYDGGGYDFQYFTRIDHFGNEFTRKIIHGVWVKGRIISGTILNINVHLDELGRTATYEKTVKYVPESGGEITDVDNGIIIQGVSNPLGANPLGSQPLGGTISDIGELDPFLVYFPLPLSTRPFNVQIEFKTSGAGKRAVVDAHAVAVSEAPIQFFPKKGS